MGLKLTNGLLYKVLALTVIQRNSEAFCIFGKKKTVTTDILRKLFNYSIIFVIYYIAEFKIGSPKINLGILAVSVQYLHLTMESSNFNHFLYQQFVHSFRFKLMRIILCNICNTSTIQRLESM